MSKIKITIEELTRSGKRRRFERQDFAPRCSVVRSQDANTMGSIARLIKQDVDDAITDQEVPWALICRKRTPLDVDCIGLQGVGDIDSKGQELMINMVIGTNIYRAITKSHWFGYPCRPRLEKQARKKSGPIQITCSDFSSNRSATYRMQCPQFPARNSRTPDPHTQR